MEKIKHSLYFRTIAVTLIFTFLLYDITWAQGGSPIWGDAKSTASATSSPSSTADVVKRTDITIPHETGRVSYSAIHSSSDDLVINIQDAHASLSAQHSIVNMLDSLASNYDLNLIAVEGSEGYVDTSLLKTFPYKDIRKKTAETLMQEGKMSAGEFFAATSDKDIALYGIEDNVLYKKNLELLKTVMNDGREAMRSLNSLDALLRRMEDKIYSPKLKKFLEVSRLHKDSKSSFADYWNYVSAIARENNIDIKRFENISRMLVSIELEKVINFDLANDERKVLIDELSKRIVKAKLEELVLKSVDFKAGKISQGAFHRYLADLAEEERINPTPFKNLINFAKYVSVYEEIDVISLHSEFAALEASIKDRLFSNDDEKALYGLEDKARILKGLFDISLSNGDTEYLIKHKDEFSAAAFGSFIDNASKKYGISLGRPQYDLKAVFDRTDEAINFYNVAQERNNAMLKNTIWRMKEEGKHVAALITGGFHSQGISELMKERGLSYMVIMPKFKTGEDRPYIAILTKKPEPYQALVKSGEYKLAVYQYFSTGDIKDLAYAIALNLKEVAPDNLEATKKDWTEKYKLVYESLPENREKSVAAKRLTPEEFDEILKLFTVESIIKFNQTEKVELNGEKVLGIIGYGKPAQEAAPAVVEYDKRAEAVREITTRFLNDEKIEMDLDNNIRGKITMRQAIGLVEWYEGRVRENRKESLSAIAKIAFSLGAYFRSPENLTGLNKTPSGEILSEKDHTTLVDTMRDRINNALLSMSISSESGIRSIPRQGDPDKHILRLHKSILELEGILGGLVGLESFDAYEKHPGYMDIRFANKPLKDPIKPVDPASLGLKPQIPPVATGAITLYSFPGMLFDLELYKKMASRILFFIRAWLFRKREFTDVEMFARKARAGEEFIVELDTELHMDMNTMRALLRSKNYIAVGKTPGTYKYKFKMSGKDYAMSRDLGEGFEYEGCVRPPVGRNKDIAHLPLREDLKASKDGWMYIISEKGVTWFRADPMFVTAIHSAKKTDYDYLKFLRLLSKSDPEIIEEMFAEEFSYDGEARAAIDLDPRSGMIPKNPLLQFQAFIDSARWQYYHHEDKLVVDKIEFSRDADGVKMLKDHLAVTNRLAPMEIEVESLGTLKFMVDTEIIRLCAYYKIDLEKLLRKEIPESLKVRGPGAYDGVDKTPITIGMLDRSLAIIEDHQRNNFIGINRLIFDSVAQRVPKDTRKGALETLLVVGITHEIRYESGETDEERITEEDKILTAIMSTTAPHRKRVIRDIIHALKNVSSKSLYVNALEELPPVLPESGEYPLFEGSAGFKTEEAHGGTWDAFAKTLWQVAQNIQIPWRHKHPIAELTNELALSDPEAFKIKIIDDHVLIATRMRPGSRERIEGMMGNISGLVKGYDIPPKLTRDYNNNRITVEVHSFKAKDGAAKSEALALLQSNDINYSGHSTIPNYTTSGLLAQLVTKVYELEKPSKVPKYIEAKTLENAIKEARGKMALHIAEMGKQAYLAADYLKQLDMTLGKFDPKAYKDPADGLNALHAIIDGEISEFREAIQRSESQIRKAEEGLKKIDMEVNAGNLAYVKQAKAIRKGIVLWQTNRDHFMYSEKMWQQLWFYLLNPEGSFEDKTNEIRAVGHTIPEGSPIILFVKTLEPIKLDSLRKRYNIQGIVTSGVSITSHWVVYAKQNGIPVIIVDTAKQHDFIKEIEKIIDDTQAALDRNKEDAPRMNKQMAIILSDSAGTGEVILRPHIESVRAMESTALSEMALDKVARKGISAPLQEVKLGYTDLKVALMANADNVTEAGKAADHQAAGLGLVRTEYLFKDDNVFEPEKKNVNTNQYVKDYLELFFMQKKDGMKRITRKRLKDKLKEYFKALAREEESLPVTIRMIDFEPDINKRLLIHSKLAEEGIAMNELSGANFYYKSELGKDIVSIELEAAMEAYLEGSRNIRVLFPMVNSMEDVRLLIHSRQGDSILETVKNKVALAAVSESDAQAPDKDKRLAAISADLTKMPVGIMIETDEARRNRRELLEAEAIDFYSVGTNDFSRFVMGQALGLSEPLDRDSPFDKKFLSILQTEVLQGVTEILETIRDINRKRMAEKSHPKELCFCGEMASWYNFMVFLVLKADKLGIKPGEIPMSLSMAGYRVPEVSMFLESIGEKYYEGINTFLKSIKDELGIVPVDHLAGKIAEDIFKDIKARADIADERKAISENLKAISEEELMNSPDDTRTLYTLELLSRKDGRIDKLPSQWEKPVQVALASVEAGLGLGTLVESKEAWLPVSKISESLRIATSAGMHQRPAAKIFKLYYLPKYRNNIRLFMESIQKPGKEKQICDERMKGPADIMYYHLTHGDIANIRIEGTSEEVARDFLKDILKVVDDTNSQMIFALMPKAPPAEPHAFKVLSGWSLLGLGGGLDWAAIFGGLTGYLTYYMSNNWDILSTMSACNTVMLAIIGLMFTVTSFIRVFASLSAIHFAHPDFSPWRILRHDIGHDIGALTKLQDISPNTYKHIVYHETFKYHVPALSAFTPLLMSIKDLLVMLGIKAPQKYWMPDLHNKYALMNAEGAITGTGSPRYDKALSDAIDLIKKKRLLAPEQLRVLEGKFSIVPIQNREYLADVYHNPSGEGWIVAVNEMLLEHYQANEDVMKTKLAYLLARQFDYILFEKFAREHNISPLPSLAETTTITLLRDTSRLNEHKDDCQKLLKFHEIMRILQSNAKYFGFEDHYRKLVETIQNGGFYGINFIGQPAWLDHIIAFYNNNKHYYGVKWYQPFDASITALDVKHILKYLRWYENNADFWLRPQLDNDKTILTTPAGKDIPLYYDNGKKNYTKEDLRDRLMPPEDKDFLSKTIQELYGRPVDMAEVSDIFVHYLGSGNKKDAFSYIIVTKDGPFEFVILLPFRKPFALAEEGKPVEEKSLLDSLTELDFLKWASAQYSEHAPRVGAVIFGKEKDNVIQMSVSYAGKDLSYIVDPANQELTPEAKREFLRACITTFTGSLFRMKGFQNVGDWKPANTALLDWNVNMVDFGRPIYGDKNVAITRVLNFMFSDGLDWAFTEIGFIDSRVRSETFFNGIIDVFANYSGKDKGNVNEPYRVALGIDFLTSVYEEPYRFLDEVNGALDEEMKDLLKDSLPRLITAYKPSYLLGEKTLIEDLNWGHVSERFVNIKPESADVDFNSRNMIRQSKFPTNPYWYIARSAGLREGVVGVDDLNPEEMKRTLDVILMDHMAVPGDEYLILLKKFADKLKVETITPASKEEYRAIIRTLSEQVACLCQNDVLNRRKVVVNIALDGDMILGLSPVQVRHMLGKLTYLPQNYEPTLDNIHVAMRKEEVVLLEAIKWLKAHGSREGNVLGDLVSKAATKFLRFGNEASEAEITINNEELTDKTLEHVGKSPDAAIKAAAELLVNGAVAKGVTRLIVSDPDIAEAAKISARDRGFLLNIMMEKPVVAKASKEAAMPRAPPESERSRVKAIIENIDNASMQQGITPLGYDKVAKEKDLNDILFQGSQALVTGSELKQLIMDEEREHYYSIVDIDNSNKVLEIVYFGINNEAAPASMPGKPVVPVAKYAFKGIVKLARKLVCNEIIVRVPVANISMIDIFKNIAKKIDKYVHVVSTTSEIVGPERVFTYKLVSDQVAAHKPGEKLFYEPALDGAYEELYRRFKDIKPERNRCLDHAGLDTVAGRFERAEGSNEFKRDAEGRLVPVKDDAYLGLVDLSILPQSSAVKMLNQLRDDILKILPKDVEAYKVEDTAYHVTILIMQEMMGFAGGTSEVTSREREKLTAIFKQAAMPTTGEPIEIVSKKDLEDILDGFKKIASVQPSFKLRLEGLRIGADGGVIAVWKDSGEIRHMRGEFNKKVLLKHGGTRRLVKGDDKDRFTIHTTLLRLVTDVDPKTLAALKHVAEKYKDISSKNITIDVNQISVCHENQWLHAQKHKTIGPPVQLKRPKGHAFRAISLWSITGLGGGVDWVAVSGIGASFAFNIIINNWNNLPNVVLGAYAFFGIAALAVMVSAASRIWQAVVAIIIAHPELDVWQALRHDIGHDEEALQQLKELSPGTWYQVKYHELFGSHVAGLWAFIPGAVGSGVIKRIDDIEETRDILAISEDEYEAVLTKNRMQEVGAPENYIKLADNKIEEFRAEARARKKEDVDRAAKRLESAATSAEANVLVTGLIMAGASEEMIRKGDAKVAELRNHEAEREKLKARARRKILVGIPVEYVDATGVTRHDKIISDAVKQAAGAVPEDVSVVFFEDTGDVKKNVREVEKIAHNMGAALGIALDKDMIGDYRGRPASLENLARELLIMTSRNLFVIGNPDIAKLDKTRVELLDEKELSRIEAVLNTMLPPAASKDMLKRGVYNMRMEAVAEQVQGMPLEYRLLAIKAAIRGGKKIISIRADSLGELKLLAEAHRSRMKLAGFFDRERIPLRLQVRLTVTPEERVALTNKMPDILRQMAIDDILFDSDVVLVDKAIADTATVKSIYDNLALYGPGNITIVERAKAGRDESEVPEGAIFMEYEDAFVMPYHYDAAIEAMTRPSEPLLSDRYKKWFRIKPAEKFDFEQLRRELDQYKAVLMAA
jgi:phosphoenolpyruvate-protein kinase (PTS system EI component)/phosphotransferase system HPr-like phosphotransfer protein